MKKLIFGILAFATMSLMSCKSGGDPKGVLLSFFDALSKKDIPTAKKYATKDSESMLGLMEMSMKNGGTDKKDDFDKSKMEFGDPKIEGDKATVAVKDKTSGETTNFILKKENGDWKVAFDKATMMQMGQDKMKEKGLDTNNMGTDSTHDTLKTDTAK
jgi:hypothetical protein